MSESLIKAHQQADGALEPRRKPLPAPWRTPLPVAAAPAIPWTRYLAALRRYKWLVLAIVVAGTALGFAATRMITPEYEVQATIWISSTEEASRRDDRGPIRSGDLLNPTAWLELFKSFAVLDPVVREMKLYIGPRNLSDSLVFAGFELGEPFRPGVYVLTADRARGQYALTTNEGLEVDRGTLGDSVGREMGFRWAPDSAAVARRGSIEFLIVNPRDVSVGLRDRVTAVLPERSNFLRVTLAGTNPHRTEAILNTWIHQFVATAAELKKRTLVELGKVLEAQMSVAASGLRDAEDALRSFRARTITLPSDRGASETGDGADPVVANFFSYRTDYENVRHDRQVMEERLRDVRAGTLAPEALLSIPSAEGWMESLRAAIADLHARQAELETARERYTDEHQTVQQLRASVARLRSEVIPERAERVLAQLTRQETDLGTRIQSASRDLQGIPDRTIDEMRLRRELASAQDLYTTLVNRYEETRLAEASAVPDVSILDEAVAPQWPTRDRAPALLMLAFLVSVVIAIAVALLLDHMDRRFRYPEQAAEELGLSIVGTVPPIDPKLAVNDLAAQEQVTEAFRSIRMHLEQAFGTSAPVVLTISSPGVGDGKSLVSSRLAMSFAEAGHRTLLIDGDIRRGRQHAIFDAEPRPGLLDYLGGDASIKEVLQPSAYENLSIIARGAFRDRGPELLSSDGMSHLIAMLEDQYDAVIVDSPPLGANIDPVALGTATGAMLLVLRSGETDRRVAEAKVRTLEYFPIRLLGAVLNDVALGGPYQQYHYLYWSDSQKDEAPARSIPSRRPSRIGEIAATDGQEATHDALESRTP